MKENCMQSSFAGSKYCNASLSCDEKQPADTDQYIAAGYVVTTRGSVYFINFYFCLVCRS